MGHGAYRDGHLLCRKRLAQLYKEKDKNGQFRGGPAWYMARGLGMRWMGVLFSLFLLLAYGLIFNTVQANSVAHALRYAFACPEWITGLVLALCILLTISTGLKGVARLMQWLVPVMGAAMGCRQPVRRRTAYRAGAGSDCNHLQKRIWLARGGHRAHWAIRSARR